jgi:hypothetical protein
MATNPIMYEFLARERRNDLLREAEQSRLVRLATSDQESAGVWITGILARIRQRFAAAHRAFTRPAASPAG